MMRQYREPLAVRLKQAEREYKRYWSDPDYRLAAINRERVKRGAPALESLEDVQTRGQRRG